MRADRRRPWTAPREAKIHFTVADVEERASTALRLAAAHGIGRLHAQIDVDFATRLVSFEGVMRARDRFAGVVDVTLVAFPQEGIVADPEAPALLREALGMGAAAVGGLPEVEASVEDQRTHVETVLDLAAEFDVGVEMHADYMDRAELKTLEMLAEATVAHGMQGRVVASHCNALAVYPDGEATRVIDKVLDADMAVTVLPIANLQMLGGDGRTPRNRGSSRVKEMLDAGINVAAGRRQYVRHLVPLQSDGPGGARLHDRAQRRHEARRGGPRGLRDGDRARGKDHRRARARGCRGLLRRSGGVRGNEPGRCPAAPPRPPHPHQVRPAGRRD